MKSMNVGTLTLVVCVAATFVAGPAAAQLTCEPTPPTTSAGFNCLPSCDVDDGRFLAITTGAAFLSLSDPILDLSFTAPAGTASFEIGIFDGDARSGPAGDRHWDAGNPGVGAFAAPIFEYTLYADPGNNVDGTEVVAGPFIGTSFLGTGNDLADNTWCNLAVTTGPEAQAANGDYVYRLRVEIVNPGTTQISNSFKVRTSELGSVESVAQPFGYIAQKTFPDNPIIYPNYPALSPTTYDGDFSFFVAVEAPTTEFSVWDGDFDRGDFDGANSDTDDANTPGSPFEPVWATDDALPEGVAAGTGPSTGAPPDDRALGGSGDEFLRQPSVLYDLVLPGGTSSAASCLPANGCYRNDDPSGNQEWEEFKLSTVAGDPTADAIAGSLPEGNYQLAIRGVDMANLNFLLLPSRVIACEGTVCPEPRETFAIGDTVFEDTDGDGVQDAGEPGIQGVQVNLLGEDGNVIDTTVSDANGNYSFSVYPATYTVEVDSSNFGAPADSGAIGDRVWYDADGDGLQGPVSDEPGLPNVALRLYLDGGDGLTDGADDTFVDTVFTGMEGEYSFNGLADGDYWVEVVEFTVPDGLVLSGGSDPSAIQTIAGNVVDTVDFGYENADPATAIIGNLVWNDADGDGIQDAGEAGIGGVTLQLIDAVSGTVVAETRTAADGSYLFVGVAPGDYRIDVTDTAGILAAYDLTVGPESNPDPTADFSVAAGEVILSKDFGYQNDPLIAELFDISDSIWFDADRDGVRDEVGTGIAGVTVNLLDSQDRVIATTTTDANGDFTFADLPDGEYTIMIADHTRQLAGLLATTPNSARGSRTVTLAGADVSGDTFGWIDQGALEGATGTTDDGDGDVDRHTDTVIDADVLDYDFGYQRGDLEGCTPGFWKQPHHFGHWPAGLSPDDLFCDVFGVGPCVTLLDALKTGGGGFKALGRHAVAALLNAADDDVNFDLTEAEVIALVQAAYASGDPEDAKDLLESENEQGCPLGNTGEADEHQLTVVVAGDGTVSGSGISCGFGGGNCTEGLLAGTVVSLSASAEPGWSFSGWSGDCSATGEVTMSEPKTCTALFELAGG